MKFFKFQQKVYLYLTLSIFIFLLLLAGTLFSVGEYLESKNDLIEQDSDALVVAERLRFTSSRRSALIPIYVLSGEEKLIPQLESARSEFKNHLRDLKEKTKDTQSLTLLDNIEKWETELYQMGITGIKMKNQGQSTAQVHDYFNQNTKPLSVKVNDALTEYLSLKTAELEEARLGLSQTNRQLIYILGGLFFLGLFCSGTIFCLLVRSERQKRLFDKARDLAFEQEKRLSQARKETVEVVSHDLRSPLATIRMSVELAQGLLKEQKEKNAHLDSSIQVALRAVSSMEELINDLLDHAKIEAHNFSLDAVPQNVGSLIERLVEIFAPIAFKKGVTFECHHPQFLAMVCFDRSRLYQALANLLGNAIKFTPPGGVVRLHVEQGKDLTTFSVEDSGAGISAEQLPHIFNRYWQVRSTAASGTGLGLAITKGIVDAHGAELKVESQVGKGSRFYFSLVNEKMELNLADEESLLLKEISSKPYSKCIS
jgi:signal transduction histidine kinase